MIPRLLAVDLDGTLLTSGRQIHPRNLKAIERIRAAGTEVVLASGRIFTSLAPYAEQLDLAGPFICCNGAHAVDKGIELMHDGLSREVMWRACEYCQAHRVHLNVYARTELFFLVDSEWGELYQRRAGNLNPKLLTEAYLAAIEPTKLLVIDHPEAIPRHAEQLRQSFGGLPFRFTESEPEYLDIMSPTANKGVALRKLAKLRGVDRTNVAAIGDYYNDLEMIRFAGVSAAIGNAVREVRETANSVVSSNDQAGVAEFVDSIMVNRQE